MNIQSMILMSAALLLTACTALHEKSLQQPELSSSRLQPLQQRDIHLKQQVEAYTQGQSTFNVAFNDLNQDGIEDAIVLLNGLDWCGSGGCSMLVFKGGENQQFEFLSKTTLVDTPVYVTSYMHNGWKQLFIYTPKHGQVMLKFDGKQYPFNPSLLPLQTAKLAPNSAQLIFGEE
ncbi:hypothetical protein ACG9YX_04580 [Acinetobacter nematophilus]|uniref:hypothetical protein n=1 Tax=Acinetobacter TaxID=469 RepID=UPI00258B9A79|nr:hypothetical protein [Acinetobacter sp.]